MKSSTKFLLSIILCWCVAESATLLAQQPSRDSRSILLSSLKGPESSTVPAPDRSSAAAVRSQGNSTVLRTTEALGSFEDLEAAEPRGGAAISILSDAAGSADLASGVQPLRSSGSHEDLDALLWLRTSAEFDALTRQTFAAATQKLGEALVDYQWSALVPGEQARSKNALPPCVIVDVDETMLDNSMFQLELIRDDAEYETDRWNSFVTRRRSPAIEGAVEFTVACRVSGVKVFFVTNREFRVEAATRDNLVAQRLMSASDPDRILSKGEQPGWTSDKSSRRQAIAKKYRVLLLVGDDLNDFVSAKKLTVAQRGQLYLEHKQNWGARWFMVPNPNYGSWEQATYGHQFEQSQETKRELKMDTLLKAVPATR